MWSALRANWAASKCICLKYAEIIRCVIFPDSLKRPEKDHHKMFYPSLQSCFMFAEFNQKMEKKKKLEGDGNGNKCISG